jgi:hypothetical protein
VFCKVYSPDPFAVSLKEIVKLVPVEQFTVRIELAVIVDPVYGSKPIAPAEKVQALATDVLAINVPAVVTNDAAGSDETINKPTKHVSAVVDLANDIFDFFTKTPLVLFNSFFIDESLSLFLIKIPFYYIQIPSCAPKICTQNLCTYLKVVKPEVVL